MEEYPPAMNNESVNPKPNRLHNLAFLKIGLVEIGFVAVVLFLFFGILNYFNILSVSDAFPKYLSWLPRQTQTVLQGGTLQNNISTNNSARIPPSPPSHQSPPPPPPSQFDTL